MRWGKAPVSDREAVTLNASLIEGLRPQSMDVDMLANYVIEFRAMKLSTQLRASLFVVALATVALRAPLARPAALTGAPSRQGAGSQQPAGGGTISDPVDSKGTKKSATPKRP